MTPARLSGQRGSEGSLWAAQGGCRLPVCLVRKGPRERLPTDTSLVKFAPNVAERVLALFVFSSIYIHIYIYIYICTYIYIIYKIIQSAIIRRPPKLGVLEFSCVSHIAYSHTHILTISLSFLVSHTLILSLSYSHSLIFFFFFFFFCGGVF
jgi:hypothetical protein